MSPRRKPEEDLKTLIGAKVSEENLNFVVQIARNLLPLEVSKSAVLNALITICRLKYPAGELDERPPEVLRALGKKETWVVEKRMGLIRLARKAVTVRRSSVHGWSSGIRKVLLGGKLSEENFNFVLQKVRSLREFDVSKSAMVDAIITICRVKYLAGELDELPPEVLRASSEEASGS